MKFHLQNNSDTKTKSDTVTKAVRALWPTHLKDIPITLLCRSLSHHSHDPQNKSDCSQPCVIAGLEAGRGDPLVYGPHRFSSGSSHPHGRLWEVLLSSAGQEPGEAAREDGWDTWGCTTPQRNASHQ